LPNACQMPLKSGLPSRKRFRRKAGVCAGAASATNTSAAIAFEIDPTHED
jgi:hypothetical protein